MTGVVRTLSGHGDEAVAYDTETGVVEEAEKVLAEAIRTSQGVFDGTTREQIRQPDVRSTAEAKEAARNVIETHEEVLIVPRMAGG
jgi:hypothetical protein